MPNWLPFGTYNFGDCVVGSDGMAYCLLAATSSPPGYPYIGITSDPTVNGKSLTLKNQNGIDFGGDFQTDPPSAAPNPFGAQWVNLSMLSPRVPPWSISASYQPGDLVYYPNDQPSVVWRCNRAHTGLAPTIPAQNVIAVQVLNTTWDLISNPLQYTAFNPTLPYNFAPFGPDQPLPAIRPAPI